MGVTIKNYIKAQAGRKYPLVRPKVRVPTVYRLHEDSAYYDIVVVRPFDDTESILMFGYVCTDVDAADSDWLDQPHIEHIGPMPAGSSFTVEI